MAQKRIYELTEDTAPTSDMNLPIDKSGAGAATRVTIANLLQKIRVGLQTYGGDTRGTAAVDLQITRAANNQVAAGTNSVIGGGENNRAGGYDAVVAGGDYNVASGSHAAIGGGDTNTASGINATVAGGVINTASSDGSTVGGGSGNTASGSLGNATVAGGETNTASGSESAVGGGGDNTASGGNSTVAGGSDNAASGNYAWAPGGYQAVADKYGQGAHAAGRFAADGDAQHSWLVVRRAISNHTDTTWYDLFLNGSSMRLTVPLNTMWQFKVMLIGATSNVNDRWSYEIKGSIINQGTNIYLLGTPAITELFESDANYRCQVVADDANDAMGVQVGRSGGTDYNIRWVAAVELVEMGYP